MNYRHNFAAHSGDEQIEDAKTYLLLHPGRKFDLPYLPTIRLQPDIVLPGAGERGFSELIQHVADKVVEKYDKTAQTIIASVTVPGIEFWVDAAEKGLAICIDDLVKANRK